MECCGFTFYNDFDSANLAKVAHVPQNESAVISTNTGKSSGTPELPDAEFNLWTKPDCWGTEFENTNKTWFYFGVKAPAPTLTVKFNIVDLNRQGKMYGQGMAPVYRILPAKPHWERIRDKPIYKNNENICKLSFKFKTPENLENIMYFAFTYPFSCTDLMRLLINVESKILSMTPSTHDDIYYTRETVCHSLRGREVYLLTISSHHGILPEREIRLTGLFPNVHVPRPFKFKGKKIIFVSARVHPGETPSTFVFNGLLNLLLTREDPTAIMLRRMYVFKMIPILNPDGVFFGHFRTDTRGVNLNRVYLKPLLTLHPTIYAARALIRYYHYGSEIEDNEMEDINCEYSQSDSSISSKVSHMTLEETTVCCSKASDTNDLKTLNNEKSTIDSGLYLYVDLHGHASKKGIFMYGNNLDDNEKNVECMLLPKLMSLNNHNFHFPACNFTKKNMYTKDKRDGMSREGSGRVAVWKITGLTKSYTLECNYNTGRFVNILPPPIREPYIKINHALVPPKFTPLVFEEVGRALGASILDLTGNNPCSRLPNSEFHTLNGLKDWLNVNCVNHFGDNRRIPVKIKFSGLHSQDKPMCKRPPSSIIKLTPKKLSGKPRPATAPVCKKQNIVIQSTTAIMCEAGCSTMSIERVRDCLKTTVRQTQSLEVRPKINKDINKYNKGGGSSATTKEKQKNMINRNKYKGSIKKLQDSSSKVSKTSLNITNIKQQQLETLQWGELCLVKIDEDKIVIPKNKVNEESTGNRNVNNNKYNNNNNFNNNNNSSKTNNKINSVEENTDIINEITTSTASTSKRVNNILKRSFGNKTSFFSKVLKMKKHNLRKINLTADISGKIDKSKKRKKFKS